MAGINNLKEVYEKKGKDFLHSLLNNYVIVNERVDGTFFGVKKNSDDTFRYFKKSGEISHVDRILMRYYNAAISYFESLPIEKRQRIPSNFYFGFEYFTSADASKVKYDNAPKNNLVLSHIHKLDNSGKPEATVQNKEQLDKWADYLGVERAPIIFQGLLDEEQKIAILDFVYSPADQLIDKFKTNSFTKYIISVLNPDQKTSFLKNDLDGNIESIIFRFYDESQENPEAKVFLAKLVDPIFQNKIATSDKPKENRSQDYIWLIVIDLMNHFEMYDLAELKEITSSGTTFDEKYITLINRIFKDFIKEYSGKYEGLTLELPEYLKRPEFELDTTLIKDPEVLKLIKNNDTYTEIYKILINFFRRTRKKSTAGFFTPELLTQLNLIVTKIKNVIMGDEVYESLFPSFNEFIGNSGDLILSEKEIAKNVHVKKELIPVNILIGLFQPLNMGHIKAAEKLKEKNGNRVVLIAVKSDGFTARSPFSLRLTKMMIEKAKHEYPDIIIDAKIIAQGQLENMINVISSEYKPILCGTSDRSLKDYALQLDYIKKKNIPLRIAKEFKLVELPIFTKSEDVISAIKNSNFTEFKKLVPTSINSEFFNLQKELETNLSESQESPLKKTGFSALFENEVITADVIDPKLKEDNTGIAGI